MLSTRAKWFIVIGIALVLAIIGVIAYFMIIGRLKIGAAGDPTVVVGGGNAAAAASYPGDTYLTPGVSNQKITVKQGSGGTITSAQIYPYVKSGTTCQVGSTPLPINLNVGAASGDIQTMTIGTMPSYDSISTATADCLYNYYGPMQYLMPDGSGTSVKAMIMVISDSAGAHQLVPRLFVTTPPGSATQTKEVAAGSPTNFTVCGTGSTLNCDAITQSDISKGFAILPTSEGGYVGGLTIDPPSRVTSLSAMRVWFKAWMPGTYRVMNTDLEIKVTGEATTGSPEITSFTADPSTVIKGGSSKLTWQTKNVNYCTINGSAVNEVNGYTVVNPTQTTAYALACTNTTLSQTANRSVTVTVSGGCTSNSQCDDSNKCTYDLCNTGTGTCSHQSVDCPSGQTCNSSTGQCSTGGGTTGCTSSDLKYSFTPNAWNIKTNNFTAKTSKSKLSDYFNSFLGTLVVRTYNYPGSGKSYVSNPPLSAVPSGVGYWFNSGAQNPICLGSSNASANNKTSYTVPGSLAMIGNPTKKSYKMGNIYVTIDGKKMSLIDASIQSPALVKAIFTYKPGADYYNAYYAKVYSSFITGNAKEIGALKNVVLEPGNGFWIVLNSKIKKAVIMF